MRSVGPARTAKRSPTPASRSHLAELPSAGRHTDALSANAEGDARVEAAVLAEVRGLCAAHPIYGTGA